jgi:hypothetical protein
MTLPTRPSLRTLQQGFAAELMLPQPTDNPPLLRSLAGQAPRWAVYRHAYRSRLVAALRSNYPVLFLALGDDGFDALALDYLAQHPSTHASIRWFGHQLAQHMAGAGSSQVPHPALVDLARMEWALGTSFDSPDALPLQPADLATTAPEDWPGLRFGAHPALRLVDLDWAVEPIWHQLNGNDHAETTEPEALHHVLLVWRPALATRWRSLDAAEAGLLRQCLVGADVASLCAAASTLDTVDAPGQDQGVATALGWLQRWVTDGLLCAAPADAPA